MAETEARREALAERSKSVERATRKIRLLGHLRWPLEAETRFLDSADPHPEPPGIRLDPVDPVVPDDELKALQDDLDRADPAQDFLARTLESSRQAQALTTALGSHGFVKLGLEMYGRPNDPVAPGAPSALEAARLFIAATDTLNLDEPPTKMDATEAAEWLRRETLPYIDDPQLEIELDPGLASLATAGSTRIRLRADAHFSEIQLNQLLQHEALVHAATRRNGQEQDALGALAMGPPRTTEAQEGLATFAELITDCMDLQRLRRIALRVVALQMALDGADFVQLWTWFREQRQTPEESYHSTRRILRGGDASPGGGVFAKDGVYVSGLLRLHALLLASMRENDNDLPMRLFAGRLSFGDAVRLRPLFEDGTLTPPPRMPQWAAQRECLGAFLSFSALTTRFDLNALALDDFANAE